MVKQKKLIPILVIVAILVGAFYYFGGSEKETSMLSVRMYDKNGDLITKDTFSIVQGTLGVVQIDITATLTNVGDVDLENCHIITASTNPTALSTAFSGASAFNLAQGASNSWTSSRFDVAEFEDDPQPVSFEVAVRCQYDYSGTTNYVDRLGVLSLTIEQEVIPEGDYTVSVSHSGSGNIGNNVVRRTSSLSYGVGSAIAVASSCGEDLIAYGQYEFGISGAGTCDNSPYLTTYRGDMPGGLVGSTGAKLYGRNGFPSSIIAICDDNDGATHTWRSFSSGDPDAVNVDTSKTSIDSSKEVGC